jgi:hypothetical protein
MGVAAMDIIVPVLFLAGFVGIFAWIIVTQTRAQRARDAALDALAATRGWRLSRGIEGRRRVATIVPEAGGWRLRLATGHARGQRGSGSVPGFAEFRAEEPAWPGGRAVFAQPLPGAFDGRMGAAGLVGFLQSAALRTVLARVVEPETLADLPRLQSFDPPQGIALMILSTEDPREGNLQAIHDAVHGWRPVARRDMGPPAVTIGPEGMTLRVPGEVTAPDDVAALVGLGERLSRALR